MCLPVVTEPRGKARFALAGIVETCGRLLAGAGATFLNRLRRVWDDLTALGIRKTD